MKPSRFAVAVAALLSACGANAQLLDQPAPQQLQNSPATPSNPFAVGFQPFPRPYKLENDTTTAYDTIFDSYRSDPKLMVGVELNPYLGIETGYANLFSRGFHFVDYGRADERAGALGTKGFSSYVAGKLTVPVGERLSAYGKLGLAYSQRKGYDEPGKLVKDRDIGPYANVGAHYRLNDKASVSGEFTRVGATANKWGSESNGTGVSTTLKVGF